MHKECIVVTDNTVTYDSIVAATSQGPIDKNTKLLLILQWKQHAHRVLPFFIYSSDCNRPCGKV